jgi:L-fucose mutarotase
MGLLKGLDPLLSADLLYILRAMGHGDELAVVDCNFPAVTTAAMTLQKKPVIVTSDAPAILSAISSVMPLDFFVPDPVLVMGPQEGVALPPLGAEVHAQGKEAIRAYAPVEITPLERFSFYDRANKAFAVVQTLERRPYGNFILKKGVVGPDGNDLKP